MKFKAVFLNLSFIILTHFLSAQRIIGPLIKFENTNYDFGEISQNVEATCTFKFTNEGDQPLIITSAKGSCSCTVPNWPKEFIQPGNTENISIVYDAKKAGNFSRSVAIRTNDTINPMIILKITGNVLQIDENQTLGLNNNIPVDTIKIGNQTWTSSNLNVSTFQNGDTIPQAKTDEEWVNAGKEGKAAWCYYNNDSTNASIFGRLYNFYAIADPRGIAPEGFRIPSTEDWNELENYLGGFEVAGEKLKNTKGWHTGNGSNISGFSGLPGGSRSVKESFKELGEYGYWWSSTQTEWNPNFAFMKRLDDSNNFLYTDDTPKIRGCSVRCIKN